VRFHSLNNWKAQIVKDVAEAKKIFAEMNKIMTMDYKKTLNLPNTAVPHERQSGATRT